MRKIGVILFTVAVLALIAVPSFAAITGTSHQTTSGSGGCGACHIPHGGGGARLWPVAPSTSGLTFRGTTSTLCASCHYSSGAYAATYSGTAAADNTAYGNLGHGVMMANTGTLPGGTVVDPAVTGLPFGNQAGSYFECTTCHNVHDDTSRPFLRTDIDALCARCHTNRNFVNGVDTTGSAVVAPGVWGTAATRMHMLNPGSHPAGTDITGEMDSPVNSPIVWPSQARVLKNAVVSGWSLGGHTNTGAVAGGGVTCNTCHAVHGIQKDPGDPSTYTAAVPLFPSATAPTVNMLIIAQSTGANEGSTRSVANGDTASLGNVLCEGCHNASWNPGSTTFSHPADNQVGTWGAGYVIPTNWPKGGAPSANNRAICESCHSAHPRANPLRANLYASGVTLTPYILRALPDAVCGSCHSSRIAKHHPVGTNIAAALTSAQSGYLRTATTATSDTMGCGTCHSGGQGSAHNWATAGGDGLQLQANWRPLNNARSTVMATDRFAAAPNAVTTNNVSATCVDCHLAMANSVTAGTLSPTLHTLLGAGNGFNATDEAQYTMLGDGSHMLGLFTASYLDCTTRAIRADAVSPAVTGGTFNVFQGFWDNAVFGVTNSNQGWSRFGGTSAAPIMVCESCHELEMAKNVGPHMLLANHYEGESITRHTALLCEGCHGVPAGTHPEFNDPIARTGAALSTLAGGATRPWIGTGAPAATPSGGGAVGTSTWLTGAAGTGSITCDSCHQVHEANTQGRSLILEAPNANVTGGTAITYSNANYFAGGVISRRIGKNVAGSTLPDTTNFCDQCHAYK